MCRRAAELDVDLDTWRAGMRRAARREGMRIRTFVVEPPPADVSDNSSDNSSDNQDDSLPGDQLDPSGAGPVVFAVRTDLPPDLDKMAATMNQLAAARLGPMTAAALLPPAPVTSVAHQRARRAGHPCTDPYPDRS